MNLTEAVEKLENAGYIVEVTKDVKDYVNTLKDKVESMGCETSFGITKKSMSREYRYGFGYKKYSMPPSKSASQLKQFRDKMYVYYGDTEVAWFGVDSRGKYSYACTVYSLYSDIGSHECSFGLDGIGGTKERYKTEDEWLNAIQRSIDSIESFNDLKRKLAKMVKIHSISSED